MNESTGYIFDCAELKSDWVDEDKVRILLDFIYEMSRRVPETNELFRRYLNEVLNEKMEEFE